jgi:peptidoglycan-associated lipoprotein
MKRGFGAVVILMGALALAFAGCKTTDTSDQGSIEDDRGAGTGTEFDDGSQDAPVPVETVNISDLETVYFDFDQAAIRSEGAVTLRKNATTIKENSSWGTITVQGHTDERGSAEYNLALGERRASAVKRYLVDLGVSEARLRVVSFGEAKPAVPGHDESAWRYNRRSEFSK